ncbi:uncharacterized protein LOC143910701 [Arctopsyche grandis]|uniref:uncharacterized protein LOC143910701 n=1 Tax=Arctopsyche grandis TaxID=121162 RepID=UPI00406D999E
MVFYKGLIHTLCLISLCFVGNVTGDELYCIEEDFNDGTLGQFNSECLFVGGTMSKFEIQTYNDTFTGPSGGSNGYYMTPVRNRPNCQRMSEILSVTKNSRLILTAYLSTINSLNVTLFIFGLDPSNPTTTLVARPVTLIGDKVWRENEMKFSYDGDIVLQINCEVLDPKEGFLAIHSIKIETPDIEECMDSTTSTTEDTSEISTTEAFTDSTTEDTPETSTSTDSTTEDTPQLSTTDASTDSTTENIGETTVTDISTDSTAESIEETTVTYISTDSTAEITEETTVTYISTDSTAENTDETTTTDVSTDSTTGNTDETTTTEPTTELTPTPDTIDISDIMVWKMLSLISICIGSACIIWMSVLMIYLVCFSKNDVANMTLIEEAPSKDNATLPRLKGKIINDDFGGIHFDISGEKSFKKVL